MIPIVGEVKGVVEGLVGTDLAGNTLSEGERALAIAGALVGIFTVADELAAAGKLLRYAARVDAADAVRAGRGLGRFADVRGAIKQSTNRALQTLSDLRTSRRVNRRLQVLDDFTSPPIRRGADLRAAFTAKPQPGGLRRSGSLNQRLNAAAAHRQTGADLNDPAVRSMINRGLGPIRGGSGKFDNGVQGSIDGTTILYRFADSEDDLRSRLARLDDPELQKYLKRKFDDLRAGKTDRVGAYDWDELMKRHVKGQFMVSGKIKDPIVGNSPLISTAENLEAVLDTKDKDFVNFEGLYDIIYGSPKRPGAKNLYTLEVPNELIHRVDHLGVEVAKHETEVLVYADTLRDFVVKVESNPHAYEEFKLTPTSIQWLLENFP